MHSCIDSSPLPLHRKLTSTAPLLSERDTQAHVVYIVLLSMKIPIPALSYLNLPSPFPQ